MDPIVRPRLRVLDEEQVAFVHHHSLRILSTVGIRVDSPGALGVLMGREGVLEAAGAAGDGPRVTFRPELVEWAVGQAPRTVEVFGRLGDGSIRVGSDRARFGVGVTNLYYQDPRTDQVARFRRAHLADSTRLSDGLEHFDVVSTIGVLHDHPPHEADLIAVLEMVANTTKPLVLLISDDDLFDPALDLAEALVPGLPDRPSVIPYLNPMTPLVLNRGTGEKLVSTVRRGLPVIYSSFGMAGASAPITAGGSLVLLNAELLAGLVVAQLTRPGAPVILGSLPAFFDMRTLQEFFDPHSMVANVACAEMMAHYGIPHAGTSGSGIGWGADLAAAGQLWANHLLSLMGRVGLAPFVGGTLGSKAFSPALAVYSNDVIGQAVRLSRGFALGEEELDLATIENRGPGASFFDSDLTLRAFRGAYYESELMPRISLEAWEAGGRPRFDSLLTERTLQLLEELEGPEDREEIVARGEAFIRSRG